MNNRKIAIKKTLTRDGLAGLPCNPSLNIHLQSNWCYRDCTLIPRSETLSSIRCAPVRELPCVTDQARLRIQTCAQEQA